MKPRFIGLLIIAIGLCPFQQSSAALVVVQNAIRADFTFAATAAGAQIFGAPEGVPLPLGAFGTMTFTYDDDGISSTVPFTNATGQLTGVSPPTPASFLPFYIEPVRFDGGTLTNATRDGLGRIVSGTVTNLAMPWEMVGTGSNAGLVLYGDTATTPLLFSGDIHINHNTPTPSLTFGDQLAGAAPFNVYLFQNGDRANQNPGTDPLVFVGGNRFLTAVPEPSSGALLLFSTCLAAFRRGRARRALPLPQ